MARYRFWFHDRDKNGQPLDAKILKVAQEIPPKLCRYRQSEIDSDATANDLLQSAIEAASDAIRRRAIENPAQYLASTYKDLVDRFLGRSKELIAVDDDFLETLLDSDRAPSFEEWMNNRLTLEKLLKLMNADARQICCWRLEGYSEAEIATNLGMTPNAVSVRLTRGLREAERSLFLGKRMRNKRSVRGRRRRLRPTVARQPVSVGDRQRSLRPFELRSHFLSFRDGTMATVD
jgi:RNA polymerase sigma factor (sigma-70 family)